MALFDISPQSDKREKLFPSTLAIEKPAQKPNNWLEK
jgi:hypothetical protein